MTEERKSENALRKPRVDVVIPTYKPGKKFSRLLKMLEKQTYPIGKIIVMNTEKAFWNEKGFEGISNLQVHHLTKAEFDHGATRNRGMRFSRADIVVFMTDDAVPADEFLIEKLVGAFDQRGPGAIAVNLAALSGYKAAGTAGAVISCAASVIPPLVILGIISGFYDLFIANKIVAAVLKGMQSGVAALIVSVVADMCTVILKEKSFFLFSLIPIAFIANFIFDVNVALILAVCCGLCILRVYVRSGGHKWKFF